MSKKGRSKKNTIIDSEIMKTVVENHLTCSICTYEYDYIREGGAFKRKLKKKKGPNCDQPYRFPVSLVCGHHFCKECIVMLDKDTRSIPRCPICRNNNRGNGSDVKKVRDLICNEKSVIYNKIVDSVNNRKLGIFKCKHCNRFLFNKEKNGYDKKTGIYFMFPNAQTNNTRYERSGFFCGNCIRISAKQYNSETLNVYLINKGTTDVYEKVNVIIVEHVCQFVNNVIKEVLGGYKRNSVTTNSKREEEEEEEEETTKVSNRTSISRNDRELYDGFEDLFSWTRETLPHIIDNVIDNNVGRSISKIIHEKEEEESSSTNDNKHPTNSNQLAPLKKDVKRSRKGANKKKKGGSKRLPLSTRRMIKELKKSNKECLTVIDTIISVLDIDESNSTLGEISKSVVIFLKDYMAQQKKGKRKRKRKKDK